MELEPKVRHAVETVRKKAGDPILPLDPSRIPPTLQGLAAEAELLGAMGDGAISAIADLLPEDYARELGLRLADLDAELTECLSRDPDVFNCRREWRAYHGLRAVTELAMLRIGRAAKGSRQPWDAAALSRR
jgi:hypothetical protein